MNITKREFNLKEGQTLILNKSFNYPVSNINTLCVYLNRKTYLTNQRYFSLIPLKIAMLKDLKNSLLQAKHYLIKESEQDYFKRELWFKTNFPQQHKELLEMGIIQPLTESEHNNIYGIKNKGHSKKIKINALYVEKNNKVSTYGELLEKTLVVTDGKSKKRDKTTGNTLFYIDSINYTCKFIDNRVIDLKQDLNEKKPLLSFNITLSDLDRLKERKNSLNIKTATFFYLRKLRLSRQSKTTNAYLNNPTIRQVLDNYQEKEMLIDLDSNIFKELEAFDNWFLHKTI